MECKQLHLATAPLVGVVPKWLGRNAKRRGDRRRKNLEVDYAHQMIYTDDMTVDELRTVWRQKIAWKAVVSAVATTKCNSMAMLPLTPTHFFARSFARFLSVPISLESLFPRILHKLRPLHCHFRWVFFEIHIFARIRRKKSGRKFIVAAVWCFVFVHFPLNVAQLRFQCHYYNVPIQNTERLMSSSVLQEQERVIRCVQRVRAYSTHITR